MDNLRGIPFYHMQCDCGNLLQVTGAQAGEALSCSTCQKQLLIPSLTSLWKKSPDGYIPTADRRPYQFDLAELMAFVTVCALILSLYKTIDEYFGDYFYAVIFKYVLLGFFMLFPFFLIAIIRRIIWSIGNVIDKRIAKHDRHIHKT
jgi:hypothetical protein